jgi:hypothetical protein
MLARVRDHVRHNVVGYIALFVALGGTGAYAADTVFSTDIVDGEVKTPDLANVAVTNGKLAANSVGAGKVVDNSLGGADILEPSLAKVPNADTLDGRDSGGFAQKVAAGRVTFDGNVPGGACTLQGLDAGDDAAAANDILVVTPSSSFNELSFDLEWKHFGGLPGSPGNFTIWVCNRTSEPQTLSTFVDWMVLAIPQKSTRPPQSVDTP